MSDKKVNSSKAKVFVIVTIILLIIIGTTGYYRRSGYKGYYSRK